MVVTALREGKGILGVGENRAGGSITAPGSRPSPWSVRSFLSLTIKQAETGISYNERVQLRAGLKLLRVIGSGI